jgi:hypothetical protein
MAFESDLGQSGRMASVDLTDAPTAAPTEGVFLVGVRGCPAASTPAFTALKPWIMGSEPALANVSLHAESFLAYVPFNPAWTVI